MPIMEGTRDVRTWKGSYDFAVDGGAEGTIVLRSNDGPIPAGSVITGGYLEVTDGFTTADSGTAEITTGETADDIVADASVAGAPYSTTGMKDIKPDATGSTAVKLAAAANPELVLTNNVTAGAFGDSNETSRV